MAATGRMHVFCRMKQSGWFGVAHSFAFAKPRLVLTTHGFVFAKPWLVLINEMAPGLSHHNHMHFQAVL